MSVKIKMVGKHLTFKTRNGKEKFIELNSVLYTRTIGNLSHCSDIFIHINSKNYIDDDFFYELAHLVNKEYQNHSINWINTFMVMQQESYIMNLFADYEYDEEEILSVKSVNKFCNEIEKVQSEFSKPVVWNDLLCQVETKLRLNGLN